jgi:hypothetical protein
MIASTRQNVTFRDIRSATENALWRVRHHDVQPSARIRVITGYKPARPNLWGKRKGEPRWRERHGSVYL